MVYSRSAIDCFLALIVLLLVAFLSSGSVSLSIVAIVFFIALRLDCEEDVMELKIFA
jgi:type IV secretory pathway VirB3-like protein